MFYLGFGFSQAQIKKLNLTFKPFEDRSIQGSFYLWPDEGSLGAFGQFGMGGGGYICYEVADTSSGVVPSYPDYIELVVADSTHMGLRVFLYNCGLEMLSHAGQGSIDNFFIVFEKRNQQVVDLLLGGYITSRENSKSKTMESSILGFERLSHGTYSFIRVSEGTEGYTEEFFIVTIASDGIGELTEGIPIIYYPDKSAKNKFPQLEVVVNWPNSIEIKALSDELWPGQEKWIGTYSLNF
jgi:hypothetical protein